MKRIIAAILLLVMALSLCGCKARASMTIRVHYGGYGIGGQDLGHGSYDVELKNLKEGDYIYELDSGKLSKKLNQMSKRIDGSSRSTALMINT